MNESLGFMVTIFFERVFLGPPSKMEDSKKEILLHCDDIVDCGRFQRKHVGAQKGATADICCY
jgi:hypothetical protein